MFGAQPLEDLFAAVGMFFQPGHDGVLVGIELAGAFAGGRLSGLVTRPGKPLAHGLHVVAELVGDLFGGKTLLSVQAAHFVEGVEIDHRTPPWRRLASTIARRLSPAGNGDGGGGGSGFCGDGAEAGAGGETRRGRSSPALKAST